MHFSEEIVMKKDIAIICKPMIQGDCWRIDDIVRASASAGVRITRVSMPLGIIEGSADASAIMIVAMIENVQEVIVAVS